MNYETFISIEIDGWEVEFDLTISCGIWGGEPMTFDHPGSEIEIEIEFNDKEALKLAIEELRACVKSEKEEMPAYNETDIVNDIQKYLDTNYDLHNDIIKYAEEERELSKWDI